MDIIRISPISIKRNFGLSVKYCVENYFLQFSGT